MICWGTLASGWDIKPDPRYSEWKAWCLNFLGILLALYVFMADTLKVAGQGVEALRNVLPREFNWSLFSLALLLMAAPGGQVLLRLLEQARQARVPLDYSFWLTHFRRNQENRPIPNWAGFGDGSP